MSVRSNYECEGQMSMFDLFDQDIWCGRTSAELSVATKEKTLDAYLKKFAELRIKPPQYLCLRGGGGQQAVASWVTGGPLPGEYMTHSFGESPKDAAVSRLSQILEESPHQKYSLSPKACQGILRRAENRGKKLPDQLYQALIRQSVSKNEPDAQGGAKAY